jgi:phosphonoacetaldehyde dehydrogenase
MEALRDDGETFACDISALGRPRRAVTHREPVRLAAAITPFNHPLNQVAHKVGPAIAAGAPIVLKPSERTPLAALWLLDALGERGLPHHAVQLVTGDPREIATAMLEHPAVEVVLFTGSVGVGKQIAANLGYRRAVLELGGNDPLLVLDGASIERAAELAVARQLPVVALRASYSPVSVSASNTSARAGSRRRTAFVKARRYSASVVASSVAA